MRGDAWAHFDTDSREAYSTANDSTLNQPADAKQGPIALQWPFVARAGQMWERQSQSGRGNGSLTLTFLSVGKRNRRCAARNVALYPGLSFRLRDISRAKISAQHPSIPAAGT